MIPYILIAIILAILTYIVFLVIVLYLKASQELADPPKTKVFRHDFDQIEAFNKEDKSLEGQSSTWKEKMRGYGELLEQANVGQIILSHGTFVGEDPFAVGLMLENVFTDFGAAEVNKIKHFNRYFWSKYLHDSAYFHPDYVQLLEESLQQDIPCHNFSWSSGNYHAARLSGAIKLLGLLKAKKEELKDKRVLFIGHSHAGQVFALAAHIILKTEIGQALEKIIRDENMSQVDNFNDLKGISMDFVMLGTPYLYEWPKGGHYRVLHLINHRNHPYLGGSPTGFFHTRDGDYLQQWGVRGSDFIASTAEERQFNQELSDILGETTDRMAWKDNILSRQRVPPYGETHLIDYKDDSDLTPNWISTIFGHGVYTEYQVMLFNMKLISKAFYEEAK